MSLTVMVEILLDDKLSAGLDRPIGQVKRLGEQATVARDRLLAAGAVAGGAFLAGLGAATKSAADYADEIAKASDKTGIATEAISGLRYAAGQSGVEFQALEMGLARMQRSAVEAADGSEMYAEAYRKLGVEVRGAGGEIKDGETLFREIAQALSEVRNPTERAAIAMEIFGRSGAQMLPLLNEGADGLDRLVERAEKLGIVLDSETAEAAERFNDSLEDIKLASQGVAMAMASALFPALAENNEAIAEYLGGIAGFVREHPTATKVVVGLGTALSAAAVGAYTVNKALGLARETVASVRIIMEFYRARVLASTAAIEAETVALAGNTAAQNANAAAAGRAAGARAGAGAGAATRGAGSAAKWLAGGGSLGGGLLGMDVGAIAAGGAGTAGIAGAAGLGLLAAGGGYLVGRAIRQPLYRSGVLGSGMQEHQRQLDSYAGAQRENAAWFAQLEAMSPTERRALVREVHIHNHGPVYGQQDFDARVARSVRQAVR